MSKAGKIIRIGILSLCAVVFLVASVVLVKTLIGYSEAEDFYDRFTVDTERTEKVKTAADERAEEWMEQYRELKKEYPATVGFLYFPSISIIYPVGQAEDNEYYTTHLISGDENESGAIFLDSRIANHPLSTYNLVLYGHNMNNKSMFYHLVDLFEEDVFNKAEFAYICDEGVFVYRSLSVYVSYTKDNYYKSDFNTDGEYAEFFEDRASLSRIPTFFDSPVPMITLVTCSNSNVHQDQRFIYHGMLIGVYQPQEETE